MITFGPVPSRRLGYSLGINNIPPKHCTYACIYCQVGRTSALTVKPRSFYPVEQIMAEVSQKIAACSASGQSIDYLTFVPDGEPTLDENLEEEICQLKQFHIPVAVITNGSLLENPAVREALCLADWVSLKVDSVTKDTWHKINRPHGSLRLHAICEAMVSFAAQYRNELVTETMLVQGLNDTEEEFKKLAAFLSILCPSKSYLSAPIRPPAEENVLIPGPEIFNLAYQIFSARVPMVELLITPEDNQFAITSDLENDLLSITAVHPLREDAVNKMVKKSGEPWQTVETLVESGTLLRLKHDGDTFYVRRFSRS